MGYRNFNMKAFNKNSVKNSPVRELTVRKVNSKRKEVNMKGNMQQVLHRLYQVEQETSNTTSDGDYLALRGRAIELLANSRLGTLNEGHKYMSYSELPKSELEHARLRMFEKLEDIGRASEPEGLMTSWEWFEELEDAVDAEIERTCKKGFSKFYRGVKMDNLNAQIDLAADEQAFYDKVVGNLASNKYKRDESGRFTKLAYTMIRRSIDKLDKMKADGQISYRLWFNVRNHVHGLLGWKPLNSKYQVDQVDGRQAVLIQELEKLNQEHIFRDEFIYDDCAGDEADLWLKANDPVLLAPKKEEQRLARNKRRRELYAEEKAALAEIDAMVAAFQEEDLFKLEVACEFNQVVVDPYENVALS